MQGILTGVRRRDIILMQLAKANGMELTEKWDGKQTPVIVGNMHGCDRIQIECRERDIPYLYIDHAYFNRGYEGGFFRFVWNHYHQCRIPEVIAGNPYPKCAEWQTDGKLITVIPPSKAVAEIYNAAFWTRETVAALSTVTQRKIVIKEKGKGDLADLLSKSYALISYGSVAEVEALLAGVPVYTVCGPAYQVAQHDIRLVEAPIYPDRVKCLQALADAEWHLEDMKNAWSYLWQLAITQNYKVQ